MSPFASLTVVVSALLPARQQAPGTVRSATSCAVAARPLFNRATALLHSFGFSQAAGCLNGVLRGDARCGMGWWGLALSTWGNPFAAGLKAPAQLQRGLAAVRRAPAPGGPTARERAGR